MWKKTKGSLDNHKKLRWMLSKPIKRVLTGEMYDGSTSSLGGARYYMINQIADQNRAKIRVEHSDIGGNCSKYV